ncbi:hypothetical protein C8T65DRAFT_830213 [Cerioporus squamosus]|nr:hypothetical protein C8T65DRAFT_830213 [Cerioporus squamosus]
MAEASSDESTWTLLPGKKPFAYLKEHDVEVKPLQYRDIPRAVNGVFKAFTNDSTMRYFKEAESPMLYHARQWLDLATRFADCVNRGRISTVDHGTSFIYYGAPGDNKHKPPFSWILRLLGMLRSGEVRKRRNEFLTKATTLIEAAFGEKAEDMFEVEGLGTVPAMQGRGYARALVSAVHDEADAQGRATYLITGDAWKFYESAGYKVIAEDLIGNDNPNYHGPPAPIRLMLREPQPTLKGDVVGGT